MKNMRSSLVAAITIGLLAGSGIGVAAQDSQVAAPVEVTGTATPAMPARSPSGR